MPALTPSFLFDFESNMQALQEDEYTRFASNLWWSKFMKVRPSESRQEILAWLWSTARIEDLEKFGGKVPFEDLVSSYTTYENKYAGAGLKLRKAQIQDLDGNGLDLAAKWSKDIGAYMAYWPQKQLVNLLKVGHTGNNKSYDGKTFFASDHPVNPANTGAGTYQNIFTGAASGSYPGALDISNAVSLDTALANLGKAIAYVRSIKMPNGQDPRFLRPTAIVAPPAMQQRVVQLTNAKFLAQIASSGAGSADVEAVVTAMGLTQPIIADELAGFESDTTWFLACEEVTSSQLGAFVYVDREPFTVTYYTGNGGGTGMDAVLDRADELEWHCKGRNVSGYGHPFAMFKCKAA